MSKASKLVDVLRKTKKLDVSLLSDSDSPCVVTDWLSTGTLVLDKILGGGLPVGRVVEIYGGPSSGKSSIAAQVAAQAQANDVTVVYADSETAVSLDIMKMIGVNIKDMVYFSPDTIEMVFETFEAAIGAKSKDDMLVLIWDSIAATSSELEMENEYGKATMGRHAQLISQGLRKITRLISKDKVCMLLLNQVRQKIGVMWGDPETTFGGMAVSFHSSIRIKLDITST